MKEFNLLIFFLRDEWVRYKKNIVCLPKLYMPNLPIYAGFSRFETTAKRQIPTSWPELQKYSEILTLKKWLPS
jgi:hypothetical protein